MTAALGALLLLGACTPETENELAGIPEGAIMLKTETMGGDSKTAVAGLNAYWRDGDQIMLNEGGPYTINVSGGQAYLAVSDRSAIPALTNGPYHDHFIAIYPYSVWINIPGMIPYSPITRQIELPRRYKSSFDGDRQVLELPMIGYAEGMATANEIEFRHLTAGLLVKVKNETGSAFYLDSVVVSTDRSNGGLSGYDHVKFDPSTGTIEFLLQELYSGNKAVSVYFDNESVTLADGATKEVQVPIIPQPAGQSHQLTLKVYAHTALARYEFTHTAAAPDLQRNKLVRTAAAIDDSHEVGYYFSVSATNKVYFSKGNLQYLGGTNPSNPWKFADNQYESLPYVSSPNSSSNFDMFAWGTSGCTAAAAPYKIQWNVPYEYLDWGSDLSGNRDWGYNAIANGGNAENFGWRTLTADEWQYLIDNSRIYHRKVMGVEGFFILPDNYTGNVSEISDVSDGDAVPSEVYENATNHGAVFLPFSNYLYGYHTATGCGKSISSPSVLADEDWWDDASAHRVRKSGSSLEVEEITNNSFEPMCCLFFTNPDMRFTCHVRLVIDKP